MATTRSGVLSDPRSGARPLGNSDPGRGRNTTPARYDYRNPANRSRLAPAPRTAAPAQPSGPERVPESQVRLPGERGLPPVRSGRGSGLSVNRRPGPPRGLGGGPSISDTNYGGVIIAEFVGVILVIALAPVAKGESSSGVSPYAGGDMVKLAAATLLYAILGFVAMGGRGAARLAAWLGGLALITVGLAEGTALAQEVGLFTGNLLAASQGAPSGGSPLAANVGAGIANAALNLPPAVAGSGGGSAGSGSAPAPINAGSIVISPGVTENPDVGALFPVVAPPSPPTVRVGQSSQRESL